MHCLSEIHAWLYPGLYLLSPTPLHCACRAGLGLPARRPHTCELGVCWSRKCCLGGHAESAAPERPSTGDRPDLSGWQAGRLRACLLLLQPRPPAQEFPWDWDRSRRGAERCAQHDGWPVQCRIDAATVASVHPALGGLPSGARVRGFDQGPCCGVGP